MGLQGPKEIFYPFPDFIIKMRTFSLNQTSGLTIHGLNRQTDFKMFLLVACLGLRLFLINTLFLFR